jgi:uncharacterized protein
MKINIKAKPKSKKEYIKKIDNLHFEVAVHEVPEKDKANRAIIKSLAKYFNRPVSQIFLVSGEKSKHKVIDIPD